MAENKKQNPAGIVILIIIILVALFFIIKQAMPKKTEVPTIPPGMEGPMVPGEAPAEAPAEVPEPPAAE